MIAGRRYSDWRQTFLAVSLFLLQGISLAAEPPSAAAIESRLAFVEKLVLESSAALQVEQSGSAKAVELRTSAERHVRAAREQYSAGNYAAAGTELNDAVHLMQAAVQATHTAGDVSDKDLRDYEGRRQTVEALLRAHERVSAEKNIGQGHDVLLDAVTPALAESDRLLQDGQVSAARASLDETYERVKLAVEELRGGDTLVRELNFATPEEEYRYELDRNDTHQMLITVLLAEKLDNPRLQERAEPFIVDADRLRTKASEAAAARDFDAAIDLLEQSTRELIRAIRSAGVYIPG